MNDKVLVLFLCAMFQWSAGGSVSRDIPISDHYDGKRFFNPTLEKQFYIGFGDMQKMVNQKRPKWPKDVKNVASPQLNEHLNEGDFSLTFVNHASFLIQTPTMNVLLDPVWSKRASPVGSIGPKRVREPGVHFDSLPKIDLILISHNHYDHLDKYTIKKLNKRFAPQVIVPIGDKKLLHSFGVKDVQELDWWDSVSVSDDLKVVFTPQQHSSRRGLFDTDKSLWGSYFIKYRERSIYFGGDGGYSTHFRDIRARLGAPDVAMIGIGAYLPRVLMKPIHTSPADAVKAHLDLNAKQSVAMHFGTFQLAADEFGEPQRELQKAIEKQKLGADDFIVMLEGETKFYRKSATKESQKEE